MQTSSFPRRRSDAKFSLPEDFDSETLKAHGWMKTDPPKSDPTARGPVLKLATGLAAPGADRLPGHVPDGHLRLLTPKAHYFLNSTFGNMPRHSGQQGDPTLEMNPADSARYGLADDEVVAVRNEMGQIGARLKVTENIMEGTVAMEGKWWWDGVAAPTSVANRLCHGSWSAAGQPHTMTYSCRSRA
jgi:anaerobic selenocysteine-containing dehydrogenase